MTTLYLVRKWFLKSVKQYSKWECSLSSSPTSPCHAGIQGENNFNSNMSYSAWLCVKILRSNAGFQEMLVYELTSYTRWCLLNYLTHLFYDQIVKNLIYVWWWFSLCWNSFELIQNFRYYVLSKYQYIYTSHYHKVLCKVLFIGSSHIDMCHYQ